MQILSIPLRLQIDHAVLFAYVYAQLSSEFLSYVLLTGLWAHIQ